jgi:hypothetical protein
MAPERDHRRAVLTVMAEAWYLRYRLPASRGVSGGNIKVSTFSA